MQKKYLATLLALAFGAGAAQAQSSVTMYGDIDEYIGYIHSSSGASITGLNDGSILRSRLGFRGSEDIGNGYKVVFTLEQGLNADSGTAADSTRFFDRQAWVGMVTPGGEWRAGRQNTIIFSIGGAIDYTERTTFGSIINSFGVPSRYDNDISYKSPRIGGVQVELHYALPENASNSTTAHSQPIYQLGVDYQTGPYRLGYAGLQASPNEVTATVHQKVVYHNVYADYNYGDGTIYLAGIRSNNVTGNANGLDATAILSNVAATNNFFPGTDVNANRFYNVLQLSADYRLTPALKVGALYGVVHDTSGRDSGARGGNVGAYYSLSKRTTLYSFANYMKNDTNAGFRFSGSGAPSANLAGADINGKRLTGLQLGIMHKF